MGRGCRSRGRLAWGLSPAPPTPHPRAPPLSRLVRFSEWAGAPSPELTLGAPRQLCASAGPDTRRTLPLARAPREQSFRVGLPTHLHPVSQPHPGQCLCHASQALTGAPPGLATPSLIFTSKRLLQPPYL